ncbi:MAG: C4-dicarboxylate ABC transporter substrate-binding protein [Alphaproteobacteria bacterium]|nr:C4-dicarboxylate ABC transporter substrate-binding protein [Alphaproteobacteria bacterium]
MGKVKAGIAVAFAAAMAAAMPAVAQTAKYNWRLTTFVPDGSSTYRDYIQTYIDTTHALTDGEVRIQGFGVGVIAGFADTWKAVQQGTADLAFAYPGFALNVDPANTLIAGFPGGMSGDALLHWIFQGDGYRLWREFRRATTGLHPVITGFGPTEIFLHSHKKVETAEDLKGMKIRTAGAWADVLKVFGATPTIIAPADIFSALERKIVDATEFVTPASNISQGYHRVARYIILPGAHSPAHVNEIVFKTETWDALPKSLQQKLELAGRMAGFESYLKVGMADINAMKEMKKGRNEWVNLKPEFLKQMRDESRKWAYAKAKEQSDKGNPWMQRITDSYFAFLDEWDANTDYRLK